MKAISVYYDGWQMDCCGEPFKIGDMVQWDCVKSNNDFLVQADYYYEAHDDTDLVIAGKVIEICKEFSVSFFIWAKSYQGNDRNNWRLTTEELMKIYLENGKM